jgi:uncharacterized protein (UPF0276 family)
MGDYLIDTHDEPVCEAVWRLFHAAVERFGPLSTMIERDDNIPALDVLLAELARAKTIAKTVATTAQSSQSAA